MKFDPEGYAEWLYRTYADPAGIRELVGEEMSFYYRCNICDSSFIRDVEEGIGGVRCPFCDSGYLSILPGPKPTSPAPHVLRATEEVSKAISEAVEKMKLEWNSGQSLNIGLSLALPPTFVHGELWEKSVKAANERFRRTSALMEVRIQEIQLADYKEPQPEIQLAPEEWERYARNAYEVYAATLEADRIFHASWENITADDGHFYSDEEKRAAWIAAVKQVFVDLHVRPVEDGDVGSLAGTRPQAGFSGDTLVRPESSGSSVSDTETSDMGRSREPDQTSF